MVQRLPPDLARVAAALESGAHTATLTGALPSAVPYAVAKLQQTRAHPTLLIVADEERAREAHDGLNAFLGSEDGQSAAAIYPDLDVSPYAGVSPSHINALERLRVLFRLSQGLGPRAIVAPVTALGLLTLPRERMGRTADVVARGEELDRTRFVANLTAAGYQNVPLVEDPGTFAIRGGIIDLFVPLYGLPVRIDLFGDEVESLRSFDPDTQLSEGHLDELYVCPVRETLLDDNSINRGLRELRRLADAISMPTSRMRALADLLKGGVLGVGAEFLLPAFYAQPETLLDYLPRGALLVLEEPDKLAQRLEQSHAQLERDYNRPRSDEMLVFDPPRYYRHPSRTLTALDQGPRLALRRLVAEEDRRSEPIVELAFEPLPLLSREPSAGPESERSLEPAVKHIRRYLGEGCLAVLCCHTSGQMERVAEIIQWHGLGVVRHDSLPLLESLADHEERARVHLHRANIGYGFIHPAQEESPGLIIIDEQDLFGRKRRRRRARTPSALVPRLQELVPGDYVVHTEHGIGRFVGLEKLAVGGSFTDFLRLEYSGGGTLLLPVHALNRVQRFVGAGESPPGLDRLGGVSWQRRRGRVARAVREMADELLKLYAERKAQPGYAFGPPDEAFREFEAAFPFEETPDQQHAIAEVMRDMSSESPMERLVCGDVGYGKTEVAMRAAFRAVADGRQVAVLVPTTVLAEQHRLSFAERLGQSGVLVDSLSRFKSAAEQREVQQRLKDGRLDVVVGTHRLLSKDVVIPRLGLLVIDEEHRFGVAHKEKLKRLRLNVDVLSLTATPIPRTLNMALSGLRDLSIIATPPHDRLAVRTMVTRGTDEVLRDGILRELGRGGQVFFVHNRVRDIAETAKRITTLVPEAKVALAHGQMNERQLEKVMLSFVHREVTVLVCTAIVESGLDIPNANTMFIDQAHTLGLAQLYQLRGRIGRGRVRGYAYLLIPRPERLEGDARKRIAAIQQFSELGSGFQIATYDLEIRGAGNLLGADQSGNVQTVGYEMFMQMLDEAIRDLGPTPAVRRVETELKIQLPAHLPEDWLPEPQERVRLYRRLAACESLEELEMLADEMDDRFGALPPEAGNLIQSLHVKREAGDLGITEVVFGPQSLRFLLSRDGPFTSEGLVSFLNRPGNRFRLGEDMWLSRAVTNKEWERGIAGIREALRELARCSTLG